MSFAFYHESQRQMLQKCSSFSSRYWWLNKKQNKTIPSILRVCDSETVLKPPLCWGSFGILGHAPHHSASTSRCSSKYAFFPIVLMLHWDIVLECFTIWSTEMSSIERTSGLSCVARGPSPAEQCAHHAGNGEGVAVSHGSSSLWLQQWQTFCSRAPESTQCFQQSW